MLEIGYVKKSHRTYIIMYLLLQFIYKLSDISVSQI